MPSIHIKEESFIKLIKLGVDDPKRFINDIVSRAVKSLEENKNDPSKTN